MKLYLYCSLFALLFLVSCRSDKVYSEWSLQNRESGEYLGEKQGSFCFAAEPSGDEYLWIIESTSGEEFLIKNKKSGNYLQLDGKGAVCAAPGGSMAVLILSPRKIAAGIRSKTGRRRRNAI